ncbi:hypothetical protein FB451DRAFT_1165177 [Mycena latifolia]|nr:hypothetical protein FB451DRAFT_1165177 [Mycena latifolia]
MASVPETSLALITDTSPTSTPTKVFIAVLFLTLAACGIHRASPLRLTRVLVAAIVAAEKTYLEAVESGILKLQIKVATIRKACLRNSLSYRAALRDFFKGRTLTVLQCIREMRGFETQIEVHILYVSTYHAFRHAKRVPRFTDFDRGSAARLRPRSPGGRKREAGGLPSTAPENTSQCLNFVNIEAHASRKCWVRLALELLYHFAFLWREFSCRQPEKNGWRSVYNRRNLMISADLTTSGNDKIPTVVNYRAISFSSSPAPPHSSLVQSPAFSLADREAEGRVTSWD